MSDPQDMAEQLDEDELPADIIPDRFIEPEEWDAGAGADDREEDSYPDEDDIALEKESPLNAEDAAMHVERGIATGDAE